MTEHTTTPHSPATGTQNVLSTYLQLTTRPDTFAEQFYNSAAVWLTLMAYWAFTLKGNVEGMLLLGYPLYFMTILAVWKVLGSIALLVPRFPRLKEWAYAGIFFNMTGAALSHAVCGDASWHVMYTSFLALLTLASWALRPQSRKLRG